MKSVIKNDEFRKSICDAARRVKKTGHETKFPVTCRNGKMASFGESARESSAEGEVIICKKNVLSLLKENLLQLMHGKKFILLGEVTKNHIKLLFVSRKGQVKDGDLYNAISKSKEKEVKNLLRNKGVEVTAFKL